MERIRVDESYRWYIYHIKEIAQRRFNLVPQSFIEPHSLEVLKDTLTEAVSAGLLLTIHSIRTFRC